MEEVPQGEDDWPASNHQPLVEEPDDAGASGRLWAANSLQGQLINDPANMSEQRNGYMHLEPASIASRSVRREGCTWCQDVIRVLTVHAGAEGRPRSRGPQASARSDALLPRSRSDGLVDSWLGGGVPDCLLSWWQGLLPKPSGQMELFNLSDASPAAMHCTQVRCCAAPCRARC